MELKRDRIYHRHDVHGTQRVGSPHRDDDETIQQPKNTNQQQKTRTSVMVVRMDPCTISRREITWTGEEWGGQPQSILALNTAQQQQQQQQSVAAQPKDKGIHPRTRSREAPTHRETSWDATARCAYAQPWTRLPEKPTAHQRKPILAAKTLSHLRKPILAATTPNQPCRHQTNPAATTPNQPPLRAPGGFGARRWRPAPAAAPS